MKKILIAVIIIIAAVSGLYFLSPLSASVSKPVLATTAGEGVKPTLAQSISTENVNWAMNEVGAYKLSNDAEIEVVVDGLAFRTTVTDHVPQTAAGRGQPDLRITISSTDFQQLYSSEDIIASAKRLYEEKKLNVDIVESEIVLAMKGYKAIYDGLN